MPSRAEQIDAPAGLRGEQGRAGLDVPDRAVRARRNTLTPGSWVPSSSFMPKSRLKLVPWLDSRRILRQAQCIAQARSRSVSALARSTKLAFRVTCGTTAS
jgi:hypothetical protein